MAKSLVVDKIGLIGAGSMGGGMALLFAEHGVQVSILDPSHANVQDVLDAAKKDGLEAKVKRYDDNEALIQSLGDQRILIFSLPHGNIGDQVLEGLVPFLKPEDIIVDAGNEHYQNTERRQAKCLPRGIHYVGMGVSGGYQAARRGPSFCPGGNEPTVRGLLPLLEQVAAKDEQGKPAVGFAGLGGAGHYVKCLHNGIEHGMMSAIAEAFNIMHYSLELDLDECADVFDRWNEDAELRHTFLIGISAEICRKKNPQTGEKVLPQVLDKVVQDMTGEEGTGVWSSREAVKRHVPAPTLTAAHYFRIASAYRGYRERAHASFSGGLPAQKLPVESKHEILEDLRQAVYVTCLASYIQGMSVIDAANREEGWHINYPDVWQIWRGGCIIKSEGIAGLIKSAFFDINTSMDLLNDTTIVKELQRGLPGLKSVVSLGVKNDWVIPSMSATLEWFKVATGIELPTAFYEAQLDYFGHHMFDKRSEAEDVPGPTEGRHHFEWKPA